MPWNADPVIDEIDEEIVLAVRRHAPVTLSSLAKRLGWSKSMVLRRLRRLKALGLVDFERVGGVVIVRPARGPGPVLRLGVMRASEYPYLPRFLARVRAARGPVVVQVYDDPFKLAVDLASGLVDAAFLPAVTTILMHRASGGAVVIAGGGSAGGAGVIEGEGPEGHVTTMASTMELCAVIEGLPGPRVYASSGPQIIQAVAEGRVRYGVVWEPYLTQAERAGLSVRRCQTPFCCLLAVNKSLEGEAEKLARALEIAIAETRRGMTDLDAYSSIVGLPAPLVKRTVASYTFIDEPPRDELERAWDMVREALLPRGLASRLIAGARSERSERGKS